MAELSRWRFVGVAALSVSLITGVAACSNTSTTTIPVPTISVQGAPANAQEFCDQVDKLVTAAKQYSASPNAEERQQIAEQAKALVAAAPSLMAQAITDSKVRDQLTTCTNELSQLQ